MLPNLLEKLQLRDEKNLLIQGLPSSIEKQFVKLTFAKNITPLLRARKIEFALVFAVNEIQLTNIINEIMPAMHHDAKLWVAYPKLASKIATTLNRDCNWKCITAVGYESVREVTIDHVWTALHFQKIKLPAKSVAKQYSEDFMLAEAGVAENINLRGRRSVQLGRQLKQTKGPIASPKKQQAKSY
jgi:hypothetical protein